MTMLGLVLPGDLRTTSTAIGSPSHGFQLNGNAPGVGLTPGQPSGQAAVRRNTSMFSQR